MTKQHNTTNDKAYDDNTEDLEHDIDIENLFIKKLYRSRLHQVLLLSMRLTQNQNNHIYLGVVGYRSRAAPYSTRAPLSSSPRQIDERIVSTPGS